MVIVGSILNKDAQATSYKNREINSSLSNTYNANQMKKNKFVSEVFFFIYVRHYSEVKKKLIVIIELNIQ